MVYGKSVKYGRKQEFLAASVMVKGDNYHIQSVLHRGSLVHGTWNSPSFFPGLSGVQAEDLACDVVSQIVPPGSPGHYGGGIQEG